MQQFAFAPEGVCEDCDAFVLQFVPATAEEWSDDVEGSGYLAISRTTGEWFGYAPYNTYRLPEFTEADRIGAVLVVVDMLAGRC